VPLDLDVGQKLEDSREQPGDHREGDDEVQDLKRALGDESSAHLSKGRERRADDEGDEEQERVLIPRSVAATPASGRRPAFSIMLWRAAAPSSPISPLTWSTI